MRMNNLARGVYEASKGLAETGTSILDNGLSRIVKSGIRQEKECFLMELLFEKCRNATLTDFQDNTGWECFVNKTHIEDWLDDEDLEKQEELLAQSFLLAEGIANLAPGVPLRFIISIDEMGCTFRFHRVRNDESWLSDDLESYKEQGVLTWDS